MLNQATSDRSYEREMQNKELAEYYGKVTLPENKNKEPYTWAGKKQFISEDGRFVVKEHYDARGIWGEKYELLVDGAREGYYFSKKNSFARVAQILEEESW